MAQLDRSWVLLVFACLSVVLLGSHPGCPGQPPPSHCSSDAQCGRGSICDGGGNCAAPRCDTDADCKAVDPGLVCSHRLRLPFGLCEFARCTTDLDCPIGRYCYSGRCRADCSLDAHCPAGTFCSSWGECDGECRDNDDCPTGHICDGFQRCRRVECTSDADCGDGRFCDGSPSFLCDDKPCASSAECGSAFCFDGRCSGECGVDSDCPVGSRCDTTGCREGCTNSSNCPSGWSCDRGHCSAGECDFFLDCPQGEMCRTDHDFCTPGCATDAECPSGLICTERGCDLPECAADAQCPPELLCRSGRCLAPPAGDCTANAAGACSDGLCPSGARCLSLGFFCGCVDFGLDLPGQIVALPEVGPAGQGLGARLNIFAIGRRLLDVREARFVYPGEFGFGGFDAGGPNATAGEIRADADGDGKEELHAPILALGVEAAFVDTFDDGQFDEGLDPLIAHRAGSHEFSILLPHGLDGNLAGILAPPGLSATIQLRQGVLTNPSKPGFYELQVDLVSVDPEGGAGSDGAGESPTAVSSVATIHVPGRPVRIDLKPGDPSNRVSLRARGSVPLAILTDQNFDAATVDPLSVEAGPGKASAVRGKGALEDVDGDGDEDLVLHFRVQALGISCDDDEIYVFGLTRSGEGIEGRDDLSVVGCRGGVSRRSRVQPRLEHDR